MPRACRAAGAPDRIPHDFRRSAVESRARGRATISRHEDGRPQDGGDLNGKLHSDHPMPPEALVTRAVHSASLIGLPPWSGLAVASGLAYSTDDWAMRPLISADLWRWIEDNRTSFEPPVGNKMIWEDPQFTARANGP